MDVTIFQDEDLLGVHVWISLCRTLLATDSFAGLLEVKYLAQGHPDGSTAGRTKH